MNSFDVIIIGAGPSGILASGRAAELGAKVLLLEKMNQAGRKLLITGKGRCNVTNSAPISEFIKHVFPNGKFLKKSFSQYYSNEILALLEKYNVDITLERGGRYFPTSQKAGDIQKALLTWLSDLKVEIKYNTKVTKILAKDNAIIGVSVNGTETLAKNVIVATGGKSYPLTGSTGDGYEWAKRLGHTISKLRPALVPLETKGSIAQSLQGLNLKNVKAMVWVNQKKIGEAFGEMLFTHFGLSGPIILTLSRLVGEQLDLGNNVMVSIDLKPALDEQKLEQRLLRDLNEQGKKRIANIFKGWLPSSMIPVFINKLEIDGEKEGNQISGKERKKIRHMLKNFEFEISHIRSFKEAIITAGGIATNEVNAKTMESKIIQGLYFAGEVLDIDAETGGYNLQIAYSTGWVAGNAVGLSIKP